MAHDPHTSSANFSARDFQILFSGFERHFTLPSDKQFDDLLSQIDRAHPGVTAADDDPDGV